MCINFEIPKQLGLNIIDKQMIELMEKQLELPVEVPATEEPKQTPLKAEEKLEDWMTKNNPKLKKESKRVGNMLKQLVVATSILVSGSVFAEVKSNWMEVARSSKVTKLIDPNRMKIIDGNNQIVELWIKSKYLAVKKDTVFRIGDYTLSKEQFDCVNLKNRTQTITLYRGNQSAGTENTPNDPWEDNPPDSVGEELITSVCGHFFPMTKE